MPQNKIRWGNLENLTLGREVARFNKKLRKIQTEENKKYLPDEINFKFLKEDIKTRKEYEKTVNDLRKFSKEGAEDLYETEAGEFLTFWERDILEENKKIAERRITRRINELRKDKTRPYETMEESRLKTTLESLQNIENYTAKDFRRLKQRLKNIGRYDYQMKKAITYRKNFYESLKEVENFENMDILLARLNRIRNPSKFYEFIQQSTVFSDLFIWYDDEKGTLIYGGFKTNEEAFNYGLEELRY